MNFNLIKINETDENFADLPENLFLPIYSVYTIFTFCGILSNVLISIGLNADDVPLKITYKFN